MLVSVAHPFGTARISRDHHSNTAHLRPVPGDIPSIPLKGSDPVSVRLPGSLCLAGGYLPPDAVGCEVVNLMGRRYSGVARNGAWLSVFDDLTDSGPPVVRFFDQSAETVFHPLDGSWDWTPVEDALEECPSCEVSCWVEAHPLRPQQRPRQTSTDADVPLVLCRRCGYRIMCGKAGSLGQGFRDEPRRPDHSSASRALDEVPRLAVNTIPFPVYGPAGAKPRIEGIGQRGRHRAVRVSDHRCWHLEVTTTSPGGFQGERDDLCRARDALTFRLSVAPIHTPDRSLAGTAVWLDEYYRQARISIAEARPQRALMPIDGVPQPWRLLTADKDWAAIRSHGPVALEVIGRDTPVSTVRIQRLNNVHDDPSANAETYS